MAATLLKMCNVTKTFSGVKAIDGISLELNSGEVLALCGENGSGKSTLMKVLCGVYPHGTFDGEIYVDDERLEAYGIKDSEKAGIIMIHQELALVNELSVAENIFLGSELHHAGLLSYHAMYQKTEALLKQVHLDIRPDTLIGTLGTGQQQLIEIAKALSKDARVLILDEPTSSLTESETAVLLSIVKQLRDNGVSCVYISHKLNEVMEISNRIMVIRDGHYIGTENKSDVSEKQIIAMMVGRELTDTYPTATHAVQDVIFEARNFDVYDTTSPDILRVSDVSFSLRRGEILGISGLVGAGRTELISSIFGSYKGRYKGTILMDGEPITIRSTKEALSHGIALVPEDRKSDGIVGLLSVAKNITLANLDAYRGYLNYLNSSHEHQDIAASMKRLYIKAASTEMEVQQLSGGNQQKVVLAKCLLLNPRILILDEPTRGIDVGAKYEIYKLMLDLAAQGVSIIMVSSELPEILGMSDRVLVMHCGFLKGNFDNKGLTQEIIMEAAIGS